jgi:NAD(P) transhydrogenase subunit beta
MSNTLLLLSYLVGSVTFIVGLKMLSHPATARRGNLVAAAGMLIAIIGTLFLYRDTQGAHLHNYGWIFGGILVGGVIGTVAARKVKMTAMPEMVSMFNGMGGLCAALIGIIEFDHLVHLPARDYLLLNGQSVQILSDTTLSTGLLLILLIEVIIGTVSFTGSMIAYGKLNGKIKDRVFAGQQLINLTMLGGLLILAVILLSICPAHIQLINGEFTGLNATLKISSTAVILFGVIVLLSVLYGIFFVMPIGGADMPVVISLLNSCTGVAAGCGGLLYHNSVMLTGGILVGSAGGILTILMCKAMNRSLKNVLLGAFGSAGQKSGQQAGAQGTVKEISMSDAAVVLAYAQKVEIVPGYGLAVAQAQHACHELERLLEGRGVEVKYAIHPVAGRMPGHMNVLLAEADVSYDKLQEMEEANQEFTTTDVVLVLGANDVVNPAARKDPSSPIYGMPVLDVDKAKMVIVNKRSMKPGYAGIENALFFEPKTSMLFGDAKQVLQQLAAEIKQI